jgi:hypothetical protein
VFWVEGSIDDDDLIQQLYGVSTRVIIYPPQWGLIWYRMKNIYYCYSVKEVAEKRRELVRLVFTHLSTGGLIQKCTIDIYILYKIAIFTEYWGMRPPLGIVL